VITYAESQPPGHPVQKDGDEEHTPTEEEECGHSPNVKQHQNRGNGPVQSIVWAIAGGLIVTLIIRDTLNLKYRRSCHSLHIVFEPHSKQPSCDYAKRLSLFLCPV
jgi:hypothetical protein